MAFFVSISSKSARQRLDGPLFGFELSEEELQRRVIQPYRLGNSITLHGRTLQAADIASIAIAYADDAVDGVPISQLRQAWRENRRATGEWIGMRARDVTDDYIQDEPGDQARQDEKAQTDPPPHSWVARIGSSLLRALAAVMAHPIISASVGGIVAGLIVFWITAGGDDSPQESSLAHATCSPAGVLRGRGEISRGTPPSEDATGQIEGGDILRVSQTQSEHFVHSVTVAPGARLLVALKYVNPGPGAVNGVDLRVALPRTASQVLRLKGTISYDGGPVTPFQSTATIYVKLADACPRYIPGSTVEVWRYPNEYRWRDTHRDEDHIVSGHGLYLDSVPQMKFGQARYIYFEIEVI